MAQRLLRLCGGLGIAAGLAVLFVAYETGQRDVYALLFFAVPLPLGCFAGGAILIGFADALRLLESIDYSAKETRRLTEGRR